MDKKFSLFLILFVLLSSGIPVVSALECEDDDYVVELWSSDRVVEEYKFLSAGDLPVGWLLLSKSVIPWEEYRKTLYNLDDYGGRIHYYGVKGHGGYKLEIVFTQNFKSPKGEKIFVLVEEFKDETDTMGLMY